MGLHWIDWTTIILFLVLSLVIGLYFRKRASKNLESFFLGGRDMPWLVAGISMVATTFAADTPLAVTELVGKSGVSGNWLWWSFLAGGMLTTFFFAKLWRRSGVLTEIEFIELRYGGKPAAILRAFKSVYLGLFMNVLIIGWVNLAMMSILSEFFGLEGMVLYVILAVLMLLAAIYTSLSGIWGVAVTDVVQFCIAITGTIVLAIIVVNRPEVGGIAGLQAKLPESTFNFFPSLNSDSTMQTLSISVGAFFAYMGIQWWSSWYPGQEPGGGGYVAQRMMSTRTEKGAVYATLLFQVAHYCLRPWPWIIVALACLVLYQDISPLTNADMEAGEFGKTYVRAMRDFLPTGLRGLMLAAFLGAYLSTISTQLNWGAGYLVNDLYKRFFRPNEPDKNYVMVSRIATIVLMALGLYATTFMTSISGVWSFIMECGAGLGMVLILRWYWWRINAWSEITATIAPFIAYSITRFVFDMQFPESFFFTVAFTSIAWILATFLTSPESSDTIQKFYNQVLPDGNWKVVKERKAGEGNNIGALFVCWIASVSLAYSVLFFIGKIIFNEWMEASGYGAIIIISGIILSRMLKRTSVWQ
jgi:Na+/proline symporter